MRSSVPHQSSGLDHRVHLRCECVQCERLGQHVHAWVEKFAPEGGVFGITGGKPDFEFGAQTWRVLSNAMGSRASDAARILYPRSLTKSQMTSLTVVSSSPTRMVSPCPRR